MSSLDEANNFINCVMNRYKNDTIMRGDAVLFLIALPFMAIGFGFALLTYKEGDLTINHYLESVCMMLFWFLLLILMFFTYRRLEDHSNRDRQWRDILIHYAKERGCSIAGMQKQDRECHMKERTAIFYPASIILAFYFVIFVLTVCYPKVVYYEFGIYVSIYMVVGMGAAATILMFLLVYTYSMKYPYAHEHSQIRFVLAFRNAMKEDGLDIPPMKPAVKHSWMIVHMFLFIITWGIYLIYLLYMVYRSTNNHLFNQWSYEIQLMNVIVRHEGGKGIRIADDKKEMKKKRAKEKVEAIIAVTEEIEEESEKKAEENSENSTEEKTGESSEGNTEEKKDDDAQEPPKTEDVPEPVNEEEKKEGEGAQ